MNFLLEIYYYLFYRLAKFAKEIFDYGDYLFWGALISTALIWNYITTVIEWVLGVLHLQHNDWYYIIIGIAATVILWRYVLTEERYTKLDEKYSQKPIRCKIIVDVCIPLIFILSIIVQIIVCNKYDVREWIGIREKLFHH